MGSLCDNFVIILRITEISLGSLWGHFGIIFGIIWGQAHLALVGGTLELRNPLLIPGLDLLFQSSNPAQPWLGRPKIPQIPLEFPQIPWNSQKSPWNSQNPHGFSHNPPGIPPNPPGIPKIRPQTGIKPRWALGIVSSGVFRVFFFQGNLILYLVFTQI